MVSAMAFCANPPGPVCSTSHGCPNSAEIDLHPRQCPGLSKPVIGGLSFLFSSSSIRHSPSLVTANDSADSSLQSSVCSAVGKRGHYSDLWHGESRDELGCSSYSFPWASSLKARDLSPVSVFQGPVSCSSSYTKSPPRKILRDRVGGSLPRNESLRGSREGAFSLLLNSRLGASLTCEPISIADDIRVVEDEKVEESLAIALDEELAFNIEGSFLEPIPHPNTVRKKDHCDTKIQPCDVEGYAKEILRDAQKRHNIFREQLVLKAFYEAEKAHRGQMRASGVPYLTHCVETAILLASIGSSDTIVAAGLLHDTIDDTTIDQNQLCSLFGEAVAELVEGVSKLSQFSKLARDNGTAFNAVEADRLHTMYLAMLDVRVVLIKLADRLHNMRTLESLPVEKQERFAKETLEIFVPLANRLGIANWKVQLENFCFKCLCPMEYRELSSKFAEGSREETIMGAIKKLNEALQQADVPYSVLSGREKSLYSVHKKMMKKKLTMDEIHDILGLRLIVSNEEDCYSALQIVHELWPSIPGKLKDYIVKPKFNGYQSLHTVVRGEDMLLFEVQIRTKEMHEQAEYGLAAHWRYKEDNAAHSSFILQRVKWARWLITWYSEAMDIKLKLAQDDAILRTPCPFDSHRDDCPHKAKLDGPPTTVDEPIFLVIIENEKMTVQELNSNSTVKDLVEKLFHWDSHLANCGVPTHELRPRVNDKIVSDIEYKLKTGDVVEFRPTTANKSLTVVREQLQRMFGSLKNDPFESGGSNSEIENVPSLV